MKETLQSQALQKLKAFEINRIKRMEKRQRAFFEEIRRHKSENDFLTVKELTVQYNISRKTFDRMREKGLLVSQPKRNGKILVQRNELENFLNQKQ